MTVRRLRPFGFSQLMPNVVRNVLMVSSPYDCFILEEDGRFSDRMLTQYVQLDLASPPHFEHSTSGEAALERMAERPFDLVVTTHHLPDMSSLRLASEISAQHGDVPLAMLTYDRAEAQKFAQTPRSSGLAQTFLWTGDPRVLVAMVKSIEDMQNVQHDTYKGRVRVILVVEDSPAFYSAFLPPMYRELLEQVELLLPERLNERDRHSRRRARPKILLARNYEEAWSVFERYDPCLLGLICDLRFPRRGRLDDTAGLDFIGAVREEHPDLPVLLQSREANCAFYMQDMDVQCVNKNAPDLLVQIRRFMKRNFGFGTFVFRMPDGSEIERAEDMQQMADSLQKVPAESLIYHGQRNHISNWLMARSEFSLALEMRRVQVEDFDDIEELRSYVTEVLQRFLEMRQRGQITEFSERARLLERDFIRMGIGSMGGKARGIAFVSRLLAESGIHEKYSGIRIIVPRALVICADFFDSFCDRNDLLSRAIEAESDEEIVRLFLEQPLDDELRRFLRRVVAQVPYPLAVRSSSLHEDSRDQPLAGLYDTYMLPNSSHSQEVRLQQLSRAIRLVYASTFSRDARLFLSAHSLRLEEEKMAVVMQRLVGHRFGHLFYPDFSGVAQSLNYYPQRWMKPEDGIASVALGLGRTVVEGGQVFRFCPRHPEIGLQTSTTDQALKASQRRFYALDMSNPDFQPVCDSGANLSLCDLGRAESDGTLEAIGATYDHGNDRIYDTVYRDGTRLVNFSGVLQHGRFPLSDLLIDLLDITEEGLGGPAEIEFAVALDRQGKPAEMSVVQLRPLMAAGFEKPVSLKRLSPDVQVFLDGYSLGNGIYSGLRDIVYTHPDRLDLSRSREVAEVVAGINRKLCEGKRPYLLLGHGRWGTSDPWLGVPVNWSQVAGAQVIVELVVADSHIEASQGSHFFHNLTSLRVGFLSIDLSQAGHCADLNWLDSLPAREERLGVRHVTLPHEFEVRIDGQSGRGVALRPR